MTWRSLILALVICSWSSMVYAEFTLTPGVNLRLEYDDNIYLESDNEQDDVITTVSPNLSMKWDSAYLDVSMYASVSMEKYLDHTEEDRIGADSTQTSSLNALARLYRELLFLRVSDTYSRVPIDEGGRGGEDNRTVNLTDSNNFQVNPYLQFQLMKDTQLQMGYTYTNQWYGNQSNYDDGGGDDYESHLYSARLTKELSARLSMNLSGSFEQYRPKDPDKVVIPGDGGAYEYDRKNVGVGLTYQATERLTLNGQYGHSWLDYDVRSDSDSDTWSASADYQITSAYSAGVSYTKDYTVSVEDGPSDSDRFTVYLQYDDRFMLRGSFFIAKSDYVEIDRSDDFYGAELSGELPFNDKTGVTGLLRYTNYDQSGLYEEQYDRYSTKLAVYYATRLGRISTGYIFNKNDSDLDSEDYTNNIVFVDAALKF